MYNCMANSENTKLSIFIRMCINDERMISDMCMLFNFARQALFTPYVNQSVHISGSEMTVVIFTNNPYFPLLPTLWHVVTLPPLIILYGASKLMANSSKPKLYDHN